MKILLTLHHTLDRDSGAAGVITKLCDAYRSLGYCVETLSYDDLPRWTGKLADPFFPFFVFWRIVTRHRDKQVIDASSGDAWLAYLLPRKVLGGLRVTHSHGLEHLSAEREILDFKTDGKTIPLSKRIWRFGLRLAQVAASFRRADLQLVLNDSEARKLADLGVSGDTIRRVRLGTSLPVASGGSAGRGNPPLIVQLGSYAARKGIDTTRQAMTTILRRHPDVRLLFAGAGVSPAHVLAEYDDDLHERIDVLRRYDNADLPQILHPASILLMPSLFEGYGLAKLEAMACGVVPVVSDDPGSQVDVTDGVNGLVVGVGDAMALTDAIERLLSNSGLLERLSTAGLATASRSRWPDIAAERLALYREYLGRREAVVRSR